MTTKPVGRPSKGARRAVLARLSPDAHAALERLQVATRATSQSDVIEAALMRWADTIPPAGG